MTTPADRPDLQAFLERFQLHLMPQDMRDLRMIEDALERTTSCETAQCGPSCAGQLPRLRRAPVTGHLETVWSTCERERLRRFLRQRDALLEQATMAEALRAKTLAAFEASLGTHAGLAAAERATKEKTSVLFHGDTGVGKTHLAAAVVNAAIGALRRAVFVEVPSLLERLRGQQMDRKSGDLMALVTQADLLVLDDLGAQRTTKFGSEQLFTLINRRLLDRRQTLVTANAENGAELAQHLGGGMDGERIVSRLRELCTWVHMTGPDYRAGKPR